MGAKVTRVGGATRPAALHPSPRGQRIVIELAALGRKIGSTIGERLGAPELAANVPVLVLCELATRGPLRPRDLLAATQLTSGGLTKQLDHLEDLGYIRRSFGTLKADRRGSVISLTPRGQQAADAIAEAVDDHLDDVRAVVTEMADLLHE